MPGMSGRRERISNRIRSLDYNIWKPRDEFPYRHRLESVRAYCTLGSIPAMGLGNRRFGSGAVVSETLRLSDCTGRSHSPGAAESARQPVVPHRHVHGFPAAAPRLTARNTTRAGIEAAQHPPRASANRVSAHRVSSRRAITCLSPTAPLAMGRKQGGTTDRACITKASGIGSLPPRSRTVSRTKCRL